MLICNTKEVVALALLLDHLECNDVKFSLLVILFPATILTNLTLRRIESELCRYRELWF